MNRFKEILFWGTISLIPISQIFYKLHWPGGSFLLAMAFLGICIYFFIKPIIALIKKNFDIELTILSFLISFMSVVLFLKLHWEFFDIQSLIVVCLFVISAIFFIRKQINQEKNNIKFIVVSSIYLFAIIPMFLDYERAPRKLILKDWLPQSIDDIENRNENWCWFIDKKTGKGEWIPFGNERTIENGKYTYFFYNGKIREKGTIRNKENVDTSYFFSLSETLVMYKVYYADSIVDFFISNKPYILNYPTGELKEKGIVKNHKKSYQYTSYYKSGQTEWKSFISDTLLL